MEGQLAHQWIHYQPRDLVRCPACNSAKGMPRAGPAAAVMVRAVTDEEIGGGAIVLKCLNCHADVEALVVPQVGRVAGAA